MGHCSIHGWWQVVANLGASEGTGRWAVLEGSVGQLKDGTILVMEWVARGPKADGYFIGKLWESRDNWKILTGPIDARIYLPQGKGGFDDGGKPVDGLFIHRTLMEMPDGNLLATAYGWFKEDSVPSSYMKNMDRFRSLLLRSKDRGRNWSLVSTIAVDPTMGEEGFNEPVLVRLSQGKHKAVGSSCCCGLEVIKRNGPPTRFTDRSNDEGKTSTSRASAFDGVNPDLIEMKNGILVAGFGWRTKESRQKVPPGQPRRLGPEHGNYVAFSLDQGATWTQVTRVTQEPTTAYVTIRELQPNKLFLVYDIGDGWGRKWVGFEQGIERAIGGRLIEVLKQQ